MPTFSVVVPAYNAESTLAETLDSLAMQAFSDWQCVVVDDGSTDTTAAIARGYAERDQRFVVVSQANTGTAGAYRAGVAASAADLLCICAADDMLLPDHLRAMDEFIARNPEYDIYSCNGEYLYHESGTRRTVYLQPEWQVARSLTFEQVVEECFYSVGAVFRRQVYERAGGHRLGVYVDDYDFWLRAMARGARHRYLPMVLSVHRVSEFQQSANLERLFDSDREVMAHLLETESLTAEQTAAVRHRMERSRDPQVEQTLELQARRLRASVERIVGTRMTEPVLKAIHAVSWLTIPARRLLARRRSR